MKFKFITGFIRKGRNYPFRDKWYKDEPFIHIDEKKKKELKKRGFLASIDGLYDFKKYRCSDYISQRDYRQLHPLNGSFSKLIDNKAFIPVLFKNHLEYLPDLCISIDQGFINYAYGIHSDAPDIRALLQCALQHYRELFLKPVNDSGGNNMIIVNNTNINGIIKELEKRKSRVIINNRLKNEEYSAKIYDGSINTLRVIFFRPLGKPVKLFRIFHRFGTSESGNVDNCSKGGMICKVNEKNGTLTDGVIFGSKYENGWYNSHTDTGFPVDGFTIPDWENKISIIKSIIQNLNFLNYGGIDIASTDTGLKIIEINSFPSISGIQIKEPALIDEEFRKFMFSKGLRENADVHSDN
ncbi:MAG: hypothetical protein LC662_13895 [Rhodothermaceae bacterium]|nr:hypothetical protein [Rhodothermaceae bacterium]